VAFNTLTIWRRCFACCLLLLLSSVAFGAELRGGVVRVADGDTIVVKVGADQHKIRLSGVDAPELAQEFGKQSRANLAGLVEGKQAVIVWSKRDGYGRLLGTVLPGSVNVNLEQMRGGFA
jgi:endonuclease YncB( thermonuclease family)